MKLWLNSLAILLVVLAPWLVGSHPTWQEVPNHDAWTRTWAIQRPTSPRSEGKQRQSPAEQEESLTHSPPCFGIVIDGGSPCGAGGGTLAYTSGTGTGTLLAANLWACVSDKLTANDNAPPSSSRHSHETNNQHPESTRLENNDDDEPQQQHGPVTIRSTLVYTRSTVQAYRKGSPPVSSSVLSYEPGTQSTHGTIR